MRISLLPAVCKLVNPHRIPGPCAFTYMTTDHRLNITIKYTNIYNNIVDVKLVLTKGSLICIIFLSKFPTSVGAQTSQIHPDKDDCTNIV